MKNAQSHAKQQLFFVMLASSLCSTLVHAADPPVTVDMAGAQADYCADASLKPHCYQFIRGALSGMEALSVNFGFRSIFCLPPNAGLERARVSYVAYVLARPESNRQASASVLYAALMQDYPCKD